MPVDRACINQGIWWILPTAVRRNPARWTNHDEDLLHRLYDIDPDTLGGSNYQDTTPIGVQMAVGVDYFNNDFENIDPNTGEISVVLTPFHANHVNNDERCRF